MSLKGKTIFITGGSRGIGLAIGIRAAQDGANVVLAAKTVEPNPKLPGTIYTAAKLVEEAGGQALPIPCDVRNEEDIKNAIDKTIERFGGLDIVVNNASAVHSASLESAKRSRFDLGHQVIFRGSWLVCKYALPHLKKSTNPHILNISPPITLKKHWYTNLTCLTPYKMSVSMLTMGLSEELKEDKIAVNSLWPLTMVYTSFFQAWGMEKNAKASRSTDIMSDSAYLIFTKDSSKFTGNLCFDETLLRENGFHDMDKYAYVKGSKEFGYDIYVDKEHLDYIEQLKSRI